MYKTQIACAIIIFFIGIFYFTAYNPKKKSSKWFCALLCCSFMQLLFDIFSVYTVNHLYTVSAVLNRIVHIFYMGFMLAVFYIAYKYLKTIIEEELGSSFRHYNMSVIPLVITILGVIFLPLTYIETPKGNYSYGPAAFMTYIGVAIYLFLIIRMMFQHGRKLPPKKKKAVYIALLSEIPVAIYQIIIPTSLITCLGMVLLNVGIYLTTENPDAQLAEQLEKEKERADNANKAKTNFLANMSHEIRTPINAVLGMNELILRESKEKDIKQYAKNIEGAAKSLLSIINDILDITKIEAGKLSVISAEYDVSTVIKDVVNMISFKAKMKELEFAVVIDERIPKKLIGDDIRLRQILVNLLNNAVKYTQKGTVTLEIHLRQAQTDNQARVFFCISDTGIGIKQEDMVKLCAPFERIEEKRNRNIEGTGLGMSITKQLLGLLGSELKVSSVYGEGSEFSFELCQEIADAAPIGIFEEYNDNVSESYMVAYKAPNAKILVVDDNELNRRVFTGLLKSTKIQIDEAEGGKECLEMVSKEKYDIIFMDHMMPEPDGIETFRIMKEMKDFPSKNAPVVILTANAIVGAKEKYLQEGFRAFLEKPVDYKKLEDMIKELLDDSLILEVEEIQGSGLASMADVFERNVVQGITELPVIEGVDWNYAHMHFNDEQALVDTARFFTSALIYEAEELERLFADIKTESGAKAFCTQVHSMKNSAATIGIIPLAGMAKVLEDAARNNETVVLESMTPIFLGCWKGYKEKLAVFADVKAVEEDKKEAKDYPDEIEELLQQIKTAAVEMDIDALDELWSRLEQYQFEEEQQEFIENIHKAILNFDVEFLQKNI